MKVNLAQKVEEFKGKYLSVDSREISQMGRMELESLLEELNYTSLLSPSGREEWGGSYFRFSPMERRSPDGKVELFLFENVFSLYTDKKISDFSYLTFKGQEDFQKFWSLYFGFRKVEGDLKFYRERLFGVKSSHVSEVFGALIAGYGTYEIAPHFIEGDWAKALAVLGGVVLGALVGAGFKSYRLHSLTRGEKSSENVVGLFQKRLLDEYYPVSRDKYALTRALEIPS